MSLREKIKRIAPDLNCQFSCLGKYMEVLLYSYVYLFLLLLQNYLRLCNFKLRNLLLTVLGAGKSKIKVPSDVVSVENPFLIDGPF
jgi:hypothetical protein